MLGTVPVEEDGSAHFEVPAGRPVFFVALDENDLSVKRMQSFTSVMPGETTGCVGCHEHRTATPPDSFPRPASPCDALPARSSHLTGFPDVLDFQRDIQPILDRHCVACHNHRQPDGHVILAGDLGPHWSHSYFSLLAHRQVADGRNGLGNQPPCSVGSSASPLLRKLQSGHHDVQASEREWRTVWLWIESGAPTPVATRPYGTPTNRRSQTEAVSLVFAKQAEILRRRCGQCHELDDRTKEDGMAIPFRPVTKQNSRGLDRPTATYERVVLEDDPLTRFSEDMSAN